MCWVQPSVIINIVKNNSLASTLTSLNQEGNEELNDLVIEFICGVDEISQAQDESDHHPKLDDEYIIATIENNGDIKEDSESSTNNRGLKHLTHLTLPTKSFVTKDGIKTILENLPFIESITNAGKMGRYSHICTYSYIYIYRLIPSGSDACRTIHHCYF